jgi:hypothetical protein
MAPPTVFDIFNFLWSGGGLTDTSFLKNHSQQNNFVHNYQGRGHTSFLVMVFNTTFNNISAISWQFN